MGSIYAFTSKTKPWVKLGMTTNCPIGRIEDYNASHGTDFDVETLREWSVPDCVCLHIEQEVHRELEANDFDRVRKGNANEIFTYAGRKHSDFLQVITAKILNLLLAFSDQFNNAIRSTLDIQSQLTPRVERVGVGTSDDGFPAGLGFSSDSKVLEESSDPEKLPNDFIQPAVVQIDSRGWGVFHCIRCKNKLAAPRERYLMIACPKCDEIYQVHLS